MTYSTSTPERQLSDKATLYCPDCGHESRINGDWLIDVHTDSLTYECPNCGAVIDSRQHRQELIDGSNGSLQVIGEP
jgi:predicted RNA-binding Zn-ribbon protein involved in translation (DUF1610 family)